MRQAKSYSIVDHQLLHGGYLHRLSHQALALYLFLIVVADREGKSFYGESTLMKILRLNSQAYLQARQDLLEAQLIEYRNPYWWVKSLSPLKEKTQKLCTSPPCDSQPISLQNLLKPFT